MALKHASLLVLMDADERALDGDRVATRFSHCTTILPSTTSFDTHVRTCISISWVVIPDIWLFLYVVDSRYERIP